MMLAMLMMMMVMMLQAGEAAEENRELRERLGMQPRSGEEKKSVDRRGPSQGRGQEERALVTVLQVTDHHHHHHRHHHDW